MNTERSEKQRLVWIIDFINLNIDELTTGDFLKILAEIQGKLKYLPFFFLPSRTDNKDQVSKQISEQLQKVKPGAILVGRIIENMQIKKNLLYYEDTPEMRELIKSIQSRLRKFLEEIYKPKDKPMNKSLLSFQNLFVVIVGDGGITLSQVGSEYNLEYELAQLIFTCSPPLAEKVIPFSELVHSLAILKRCQAPGCDKFFLQIHKKEKNYCSNKCAWRAYSKFVRDEEKKDRLKQKKQR
jgi:hypothetical protein